MNIPERISALRALMEERGYDVYMVPTVIFIRVNMSAIISK